MHQEPLARLRLEYDRHAGRSIALPIAGAIVWTAAGVAGLLLEPRTALFALLFATGLAFPLALAIARPLGERLLDNPSPLAGLMGRSVLMVNLLWAVHLSLIPTAPELLPLSLAAALGLHWVVFGWVVGHWVGLAHAVTRTALVAAAWWAFPDARVAAVAGAVVFVYAASIAVLARRSPAAHASPVVVA
jgi:hypothetical protein